MNLSEGRLNINFIEDGAKVRLAWLGKSESLVPGDVLNPYINQIVPKLVGKNVVVDFRDFEYMNSSTVAPIIYLLKQLGDKSIPTVVYYKKNLNWQRNSFKMLETICITLKTVKIEGVD